MVDRMHFGENRPRRDYRNAEEFARDQETPQKGFSAAAARFSAWADKATQRLQEMLTPGPMTAAPKTDDSKTPPKQAPQKATLSTASVDDDARLFESGEDHDDGTKLWRILKRSAYTVAMRSRRLGVSAAKVFQSLEDRRDGDVIFTANFIRILIGLALYGGLALWLERQVIDAKLAGASALPAGDLTASMTFADAAVVIQFFGYAALAGAGLGLAALLPPFLVGQLTNEKLIGRAEQMGVSIAEMLKRINDRLADHRAALEQRSMSPDAVQAEVSRAHIAAEEAAILFQEADFLIYAPGEPGAFGGTTDQAQTTFEDYLRAASTPLQPRTSATGSWINGLIFGSLTTAVFCVIWIIQYVLPLIDRPASSSDASYDFALLNYPSLFALFMGGAFLYLGAGVIARPLADLTHYGARRGRANAALTAVRGAVTSAEAPNAKDIALQVEALNAIFQERIAAGGSRVAANATAMQPSIGADHRDADDATWRNDSSERRFVESDFQAAPKQWFAGPDGAPEKVSEQKKKRFFS